LRARQRRAKQSFTPILYPEKIALNKAFQWDLKIASSDALVFHFSQVCGSRHRNDPVLYKITLKRAQDNESPVIDDSVELRVNSVQLVVKSKPDKQAPKLANSVAVVIAMTHYYRRLC
jgi:hypothetical protein